MSASLKKRSRDDFPDFPDINVPDFSIPDINIPDFSVPDINIPDFFPKKTMSKKNTQQYAGKRSHGIHIPNFRDIDIPELHTRDFIRKKTETRKKKTVPFAQAVPGRLY